MFDARRSVVLTRAAVNKRLGGVAVLLWAACGAPGSQPDGGVPLDGGGLMSCQLGLTLCGDACADLTRDYENCGGCGKVCGAALSCIEGQCTEPCPTGQKLCLGQCVSVGSDLENCGACGVSCLPSQVCRSGACACPNAQTQHVCDGACIDTSSNSQNCGACDSPCDGGQICSSSECLVLCDGDAGTRCGGAPGACHDLTSDNADCGACGVTCTAPMTCTDGSCQCPNNEASCNGVCTNVSTDPLNCGGCGSTCNGQQCYLGNCEPACPFGFLRCGLLCVDPMNDVANCNGCGHLCSGATTCSAGACVACDSSTTDCDRDGWLKSDGDCCDTPADCPIAPNQVNPGAIELAGNGVDDNCNGLLDSADVLDLAPCDGLLPQASADGGDYARAMELCRTTVESPPTLQQRTWGVISADLLRADGTLLTFQGATSIRGNYGVLAPLAGSQLAVISTGLAADATQTNPGPNGGPYTDPSSEHLDLNTGDVDNVDFSTCTSPLCIRDWFQASRPPLKVPGLLPQSPVCDGGLGTTQFPSQANDSVMVRLRLRAPTNAHAFQFNALFLSAEYPEYVCSPYNDQFIALIDTPGGRPTLLNPTDKNLA